MMGVQEWWNGRGILCRDKDMASTYRLCPCSRTWCVLNFGLEMKKMEGDEYVETPDNRIGVLVNYKLRSNYKICQAYILAGDRLLWSRYKGRGIRNWSLHVKQVMKY